MALEQLPDGAERILKGAAATMTSYKLSGAGEPVAPAGAVTVTITRADGTAVATGAATTTDAVTKQVSYALSAANNTLLDWLTAVWTDTDTTTWTTYHEVVGAFYFSVADAIRIDPNLDSSRISPERLRAVRDEVERELESDQCCGRALVPRYRRVRLWGNGSSKLQLPTPDLRTVRTVRVYTSTTAYSSFSATELAAIAPSERGIALRADGNTWDPDTYGIVVEYEYGFDRPPSDLVRAILRRARYWFGQTSSGMPERATTFSSDQGGTYSLALAGRAGNITALDDVDLLIKRYRFQPYGFA